MDENKQRAAFEAAVINRMKESGFLEVEIRTECLVRSGDDYQDELINYGWWAYQAALASPEVQKQPQYETQLQVWRSTDSCLEFWSWDEADQYDYDQALPENRRIIQIIKEG